MAAHAALCPSAASAQNYQYRQPQHTALHQIVQAHWRAFLEKAEQAGGLPQFVRHDIESYIDCGRFEKGFIVLECRRCGFTHEVPFSCKGRVCRCCHRRRMNDTAAHLVDQILPDETPIRQWICSMPWSLHYLMGYNSQLCAQVLSAFTTELSRSYKKRAKRYLGLDSVHQAYTGSVSLVHRADSALRLNVHPHVLALDGVYVRDKQTSELMFHALPEPTFQDVALVAARTAARVEMILTKHGRYPDDDMGLFDSMAELEIEQPVLASCLKASAEGIVLMGQRAGQRTLRVIAGTARLGPTDGDGADSNPGPVARVRGFSVHAKTAVDGRDRKQLERLCRYAARPPLAQDRVSILDDGRVKYELKRTFADGTRAVVLEPLDFIARLCALVPPPYFHMTRYQGVLAPELIASA